MFAADLASGAALDWHDYDRIHNRLCLDRGADRLLVIHFTDRISAIGDQYDHLAPLAVLERARSKIDRVVKRSRRPHANVVDTLVNSLQIGCVSTPAFIHYLAKRVNGKGIHWAQNGVRKSFRRLLLEGQVVPRAQAGIDREGNGER